MSVASSLRFDIPDVRKLYLAGGASSKTHWGLFFLNRFLFFVQTPYHHITRSPNKQFFFCVATKDEGWPTQVNRPGTSNNQNKLTTTVVTAVSVVTTARPRHQRRLLTPTLELKI